MDKDRLVNEIVTEVLQALSNANTVNYRVHVIGELPIHYDTHGLECVSITKNYQKGEPILITELTPYMLANLANGQVTTKEEEYILYNLLHGFDVYMLEDGFKYQECRKTAYKALYSLYRDYDDKLRNYGIKVIHEPIEILVKEPQMYAEHSLQRGFTTQDIKARKDEQQYKKELIIGKVDWCKRRLVLEKDFVNSRIGANRVVMLSKGCIITPMARDYIREHQIHIEII